MLGDLKINQFFSKLFPLFRVIQGSIKSSLGDAESLGSDLNSAFIEKLENLIKSLIFFAETVRRWDSDIAEGKFSRLGHSNAHLRYYLSGF